MIDRTTRLRWRRLVRKRRRQVEDIGSQAEEGVDKHLFRRLDRLVDVRRFVVSWVALMIVLAVGVGLQTRSLGGHYLFSQPSSGGHFHEGVIGAFTNANPVYATGAVDSTIARLIFAGLLKYDQDNQLVGDLAAEWSVDERGRVYTVELKDNLYWHDGQPLTSEDVVFTFETVQDPDARSPLRTAWLDIEIEALDTRTVTFTLPNAFVPFPNSLTTGIIPKHILKDIPARQLRSASFNTLSPVGAGPFRWDVIEVDGVTPEDRTERIGLVAYEDYHAGAPKLQRYTVSAFRSEEVMVRRFERKELHAVSGLDSVSDDLHDQDWLVEHNVPLTGQVGVFFNNSHSVLSDRTVRRALVRAVDTTEIIHGLSYPVLPSRSPLLPTHLGYQQRYEQFSHDKASATRLLDEAGWRQDESGVRHKSGKPLAFRLFAKSTSDYVFLTQYLQTAWSDIGADVEVSLQSDEDIQSTISLHNYDALVYGIALGTDPDVFAYWHSSQADARSASRLNLSEYKSDQADESLEGGRTRLDPELRAVKYEPFLQAWRSDAPALMLYQPRYLYLARGTIHNFEPKRLNIASDRLSNVHNWMIREERAVQAD